MENPIIHNQRLQAIVDKLEATPIASLLPNDTSTSGLPSISSSLILTGLITILILVLFTSYFKPLDSDAKSSTWNTDPSASKLPSPTEVTSLRIYPIKSCRGIELSRATLLPSGLELDRNWMFIDASTHDFQTIRENASMTLIDTSLNAEQSELTISIAAASDHAAVSVTIPAKPSQDWLKAHCTLITVQIWGSDTDAFAYSDSINSLFTPHFGGKAVKLVYKGPTARNSRGNADPSLYGEAVPHYFADVLSVLIVSESSMRDLNRQLKASKDRDAEELTVERFRPNVVVKGGEAWSEDRWKRVRISTKQEKGETAIPLDIVARCARCQVPNVTPSTGHKNAKEPWNTLMKFRRVDTGGVAKYKPCFGMMAIPKAKGELRVGESVLEVLELTDKHLYNEARFDEL